MLSLSLFAKERICQRTDLFLLFFRDFNNPAGKLSARKYRDSDFHQIFTRVCLSIAFQYRFGTR